MLLLNFCMRSYGVISKSHVTEIITKQTDVSVCLFYMLSATCAEGT